MRLTQKADKEHEHLKMCIGWFELPTKDYYIRVINETPNQMHQKLGQLEDIEDELGIDLIILFTKATKEVWYKKEMSCYDSGSNWYKQLDTSIIVHNSIVSKLDFQHKSVYIKGAKEWHSIENYGKTWALTREELL